MPEQSSLSEWQLLQGNSLLINGGVALGFWGISAAASVSFGPLIGGFLIDKFSWPLIFDVNILFGIIAMLFTIVIQGEYINKLARKFDLVGFISVTIFLPLTLYTLSQGNAATNSEGWHAPFYSVKRSNSFNCTGGFYNRRINSKGATT